MVDFIIHRYRVPLPPPDAAPGRQAGSSRRSKIVSGASSKEELRWVEEEVYVCAYLLTLLPAAPD